MKVLVVKPFATRLHRFVPGAIVDAALIDGPLEHWRDRGFIADPPTDPPAEPSPRRSPRR